MNFLIGLLRRYGLAANVAKSLTIKYQPGSLRLGISEEARERKCTDMGDSYRERLRWWITCLECRVKITAGLITAHLCKIHRKEPEIDWNWLPFSQREHYPQVYDVIFPRKTKWCP